MSGELPLNPPLPLLLVDDEQDFLQAFTFILKREGIQNIISASSGEEALKILGQQAIGACFFDMILGDLTGQELLAHLHEHYPEIPVVMLTALPDPELIVECMRAGAYDYLVKPVERAALVACARRLVQYVDVQLENRSLRQEHIPAPLKHPEHFTHIQTINERMNGIFRYIESMGPNSLSILIRGETGTGKELIARSIHNSSGRQGPFIAENISGIDDTLFSSTLFGHRKGAFTGAESNRPGLLEEAAGGTLFLDEIGDLTPQSQKKLLRVLQEGEWIPLGTETSSKRQVSCRMLFATHANLEELVDKGHFRADLFYRIQAHTIFLPSLRERADDIPLLADVFLEGAKKTMGIEKLQVPSELYSLLKSYHWPGNIRELEGTLMNAVSHSRSGHLNFQEVLGKIGRDTENDSSGSTSNEHKHEQDCESGEENPNGVQSFSQWLQSAVELPALKDAENQLIQKALELCDQNITQAARLLGMTREALSKRLNRSSGKKVPAVK